MIPSQTDLSAALILLTKEIAGNLALADLLQRPEPYNTLNERLNRVFFFLKETYDNLEAAKSDRPEPPLEKSAR